VIMCWSATRTTNTSLNESQPETTLRAATRTPDAKTTVSDEQVKCALTSTLIEGISKRVTIAAPTQDKRQFT
jgi:hypothetical protein